VTKRWPEVLCALGLPAYAIGQSALSILGEYPELALVNETRHPDLLVALLVLFVAPSLPLLIGWLGWRALVRRAPASFIAWTSGWTALLAAMQAGVIAAPDAHPALPLAAALAVAIAVAVAVHRLREARTFATVCAGLALVFPVLFFTSGFTWQLTAARGARPAMPTASSRAPVIVFVIDELPLASLLDENLEVDAGRFGGFASFAATSTWYPNALAPTNTTMGSLLAMLTGKQRPSWNDDNSRNLFSLLAKTHRLQVPDSMASLCPGNACVSQPTRVRAWNLLSDLGVALGHRTLPPRLSARWLPPVDHGWSEFGERDNTVGPPGRWTKYHDHLEALRPPLDGRFFLFILSVPHQPWQWGPDAIRFAEGSIKRFVLDGERPASADQHATLLKAHLLQTGYADYWMKRVFDQLKADGVFDESLIVVLSDHGVALRGRAAATRGHDGDREADIFAVPLFVKLPGQRDAVRCDEVTSLVDVLPIVASGLGAAVDWPVDARLPCAPSSRPAPPARDTLQATSRQGREDIDVTLDTARVRRQLQELVRAQLDIVGSGDWATLWRASPRPDLIGRSVDEIERAPALTVEVGLEPGAALGALDAERRLRQTFIAGELTGWSAQHPALLVVASAGKIAGVVAPRRHPEDTGRFAAILPPELVSEGGALSFFLTQQAADSPLAPVSLAAAARR
jgi:hypothetical protein